MIRRGDYIAVIVTAVFIAVSFVFPVSTRAQTAQASLYFSPSSVSESVGQTFSMAVRVNTDGQAINAAQGSIVFDAAKLEVVSISEAGSVFNLWTEQPTYSNPDGTIDFEGGLPSPGYSGASGLIITISFKTKVAVSSTLVNLVSGSILANDGEGTNILSSLGSATVSISSGAPSSPSSPASTQSATSGELPVVSSSTHPDPTKWYSNANPAFSWVLPSDVTAVSYLITDKPNSNPGPNPDTFGDNTSYSGIADGTQYFHIKFKSNGTWGPIAHFQFNIDTTPPAAFQIQLVNNPADIQPQIEFSTTDAGSGVDHYAVQVSNGNWVTVASDSAGKPYQLSFSQIGTQTVSVKAVDAAGNETIESLPVTVSGIEISSSLGLWVSKIFNGLVSFVSNDGLLIALILALIGCVLLIIKVVGSSIDKAWHRMRGLRTLRKVERKTDIGFGKILKDMQDEIKFLDSISRRRRLGPEEKYLKTKLEQYVKSLKQYDR